MSDSHSNPKVKFHFILFIQSSKHSSQKLPQIGKEVPLLLGNHRGGPLDLEKYFEGVRVSIRVHEDFGCLGYPISNQLLVILLEGVFATLWARKSAHPYGLVGYQHPSHQKKNTNFHTTYQLPSHQILLSLTQNTTITHTTCLYTTY